MFEDNETQYLNIINTEIKYDGYIKQQNDEIKKMKEYDNFPLSEKLDYSESKGLRIEAQQKLNKIKPINIAQASRISGVSPADITVLMIYLKGKK